MPIETTIMQYVSVFFIAFGLFAQERLRTNLAYLIVVGPICDVFTDGKCVSHLGIALAIIVELFWFIEIFNKFKVETSFKFVTIGCLVASVCLFLIVEFLGITTYLSSWFIFFASTAYCFANVNAVPTISALRHHNASHTKTSGQHFFL